MSCHLIRVNVLLLFLFFQLPSLALGAPAGDDLESEIEDFEELDLEKLLDVVFTASKHEQDIAESPSAITVITRELFEIELKIEGHPARAGLNVFLPAGFFVDELGRPRMSLEEWLQDPVLEFTLTDDPQKQFAMCREPVEYHMRTTKVAHCSQIPEGAKIECSDKGYHYLVSYSSCDQDEICGPIECTSVLDDCRIPQDQPLPDGWPCEVN